MWTNPAETKFSFLFSAKSPGQWERANWARQKALLWRYLATGKHFYISRTRFP